MSREKMGKISSPIKSPAKARQGTANSGDGSVHSYAGGAGAYKWVDQFFANPGFVANPWAEVAIGLETEYFEVKKVSDFFDYSKKNAPTNAYGGAILGCGIAKGKLKVTYKIKGVAGGILIGCCRMEVPVAQHWLENGNCQGMVWVYQCPGGAFFNGPQRLDGSDAPGRIESSAHRGDSEHNSPAKQSPSGSPRRQPSSHSPRRLTSHGSPVRGPSLSKISSEISPMLTSMDRTEVLKIPEMGDEGDSDAEGDAAAQMERERVSGGAKVAKGLLAGGDVVECEIDMDAGVMSVWVNGVGHPERCWGLSKAQKMHPCVFMYGKGTHVEVTACQIGRYASNLLDAEDEEDVAGGGTSNSVYWHGRRGNLLEVREEVIADREGHRARAGKEDAGSNGASRRPSSNTMGGTGTKAGTTGGAAALPKTSELIRIRDAESKGQPGRGCGPMAAMLMYSACAEWTGLHCCGQIMSAEFTINERLGSMDFGAISAKCPVKATWNDPRLVNQAYWYSWCGTMRDGSKIEGLKKPQLGKGDVVKLQIDTFNGDVVFSCNGKEAGRMTLNLVKEAREKSTAVAKTRENILVLFKEIEEIKHEVLLGKFRLRWVLKDKTKELTRLQSLLTTDTKDLKNMEEGATIEYFPAVSMSRPGDSVTVSGRVLDLAKSSRPLTEKPICGIPSDYDVLVQSQEGEGDELGDDDWSVIIPQLLSQKRSPLLELLTDQELNQLSEGYVREFADGDKIKDISGEQPIAIFLLLKGSLSVFNLSKKEEVCVLSTPGHVFGEMTVFNNKTWPADAKAKGACSLLEITPEVLSVVLNARRQIGMKFMSMTKDRAQGNALKGEAWRSFFLLHGAPESS